MSVGQSVVLCVRCRQHLLAVLHQLLPAMKSQCEADACIAPFVAWLKREKRQSKTELGMKARLLLSRSWRLAFRLACLCGLLMQIFSISVKFFAYTTIARLETDVGNKPFTSPDFILCLPYTDLLDYERIQRETGLRADRRSDHELMLLTSRLTVAQLLKYTPPADALTNWIRYRVNTSLLIQTASNQSAVRRLMDVDKFLLQEFMCYNSKRRDTDRLSFAVQRVGSALHDSHLVYEVRVGHAMRAASRYRLVLTTGRFDYLSMVYCPVVERLSHDASLRFTSASFAFTRFDMHLLPVPWDTACLTEEYVTDDVCWFPCLADAISQQTGLDRVSFNTRSSRPMARRVLSLHDLRNESVDQAFVRANMETCSRCFYHVCHKRFTSTVLHHTSLAVAEHEFAVRILSPAEPQVSVFTEKLLSPEEYLIFLTSCFGVWFGLSLASLNPFSSLVHRLQRRLRLRRRATCRPFALH